MSEDPRCCGSGTCIIDTEGRCWCGQQWDGHEMCHALRASVPAAVLANATVPVSPAAGSQA